MEVDSDEDFEKVSVTGDFSDAESEYLVPATNDPLPATPATTQGTPFCREKRLRCPYEGCDKAFNRPTRLQEHIRSHTNERPFKCPHTPCDKDYLRESHLKHHIKSAHSDVRNYKCTYEGCDKAFATGQRLRVHEATHEGPNKYRCQGYPPCNQVFRKKETLQRHILSAHEGTQPFPCTKTDSRTGQPCTKAYDTAAKLAAHDRSNHDPNRFSCDECVTYNQELAANGFLGNEVEPRETKQAYFATYAELQAHNASEHPPTCPHCSLPFITAKELTRHNELIHDIPDPNAKPSKQVTCPHPGCQKVFTRVGNLNVHIRTTHQNRRDFICGQTEIALGDIPAGTTITGCGRDFTSKAVLIDHVREVHLGLDSLQKQKSKRKRQSEGETPKIKKPRKDKGVRRVPAISGTTSQQERFPFDDEDVVSRADDGELDGSITMYGSMLYDPDGAYRYDSQELRNSNELRRLDYDSDDDTTPAFLPPEENEDVKAYQPLSYGPEWFERELDLNHEKHPSAFVLEPEMSNALDPLLFVSTPSQQQQAIDASRY